MKLYIASTLSNWKRVRRFYKFFESYGIEIAYDWTQYGEEISPNVERDKNKQSLQRKAEQEFTGVRLCDHLFAIMPGGRGTHFELGMAYGLLNAQIVAIEERWPNEIIGPKGITLLDETNDPGPVSFHYLPFLVRTTSLRQAVVQVLIHSNAKFKDEAIDLSDLEPRIEGTSNGTSQHAIETSHTG